MRSSISFVVELSVVLLIGFSVTACGGFKGVDGAGTGTQSSKCVSQNVTITQPFSAAVQSFSGRTSIFATSSRHEYIELDQSFTNDLKEAYLNGIQTVEFPLTLPDGTTLQAVSKKIKMDSKKIVVIGSFVEDATSNFTFTIRDGVMAGRAQYLLDSYSIRFVEADTHVIVQNDDIDGEIPCDNHHTNESMPSEFADLDSEGGASISAVETVEMLVAYTTQAKNDTGGEASMLALIDNQIEILNQVLKNSGIEHNIKLVGTMEVSQPASTDVATDMNNLMSRTDGKWDEVHPEAVNLGADVIAILVEGPISGTIGYANFPSFQGYYSATRVAGTRSLIFQHELGHNFNARHEQALTTGSFSTTMVSSGRRIMHYSNPDITYNNVPTGDASHNAASVINSTIPRAAAFRASKTTPPPTEPPTTTPPPTEPPPATTPPPTTPPPPTEVTPEPTPEPAPNDPPPSAPTPICVAN